MKKFGDINFGNMKEVFIGFNGLTLLSEWMKGEARRIENSANTLLVTLQAAGIDVMNPPEDYYEALTADDLFRETCESIGMDADTVVRKLREALKEKGGSE